MSLIVLREFNVKTEENIFNEPRAILGVFWQSSITSSRSSSIIRNIYKYANERHPVLFNTKNSFIPDMSRSYIDNFKEKFHVIIYLFDFALFQYYRIAIRLHFIRFIFYEL